MKKFKKIKLLIIIIIVLILLGGGYYAYNQGYFNNWFKQAEQKPAYKTGPDGERIFTDEEISKYNEYLKQAHQYILAGDAGDKSSYEKAVEAYKQASAIGDDKFWNPLVGLASAYRKLGDYEAADKAYDKALIASQYGEGKIYQERIDMYRYEMKKSPDDIKKVYEEALQKVTTDNAAVILSYGAYLRDIGDYAGALKYYTMMSEKFPDNQLYTKEIESLKAKLGQ